MNGPVQELAGRTFLVSGAAGAMGVATARLLRGAGARLCLTDRHVDPIEALAQELDETGREVIAIACDQAEAEDVDRLSAQLSDRLGALDGAFVNAGIGRYCALLDVAVKDWKQHVDVNLTGSFLVAQAAARLMIGTGRGGALVFNASTAAAHAAELFGAYGASKAGLRMLSRTLAGELGAHGIRANLIMPGVIETRMTSGLLADPEINADIVSETPVGRLGRPEDIAELALFLLSDRSTFITGAEILIDGGQTLHGYPRWFSRTPGDVNHDWSLHAKRT